MPLRLKLINRGRLLSVVAFFERRDMENKDLASVATRSKEFVDFRRVGDKVFYADDDDVLNEIIAPYEADDEGDDEDEGETCDECGAQVDEVIGCPDGMEICRKCFDQGAH